MKEHNVDVLWGLSCMQYLRHCTVICGRRAMA